MFLLGKRYRFSNCVLAICIPTCVVLVFYASILNRNLYEMSTFITATREPSLLPDSRRKQDLESSWGHNFYPVPVEEGSSGRNSGVPVEEGSSGRKIFVAPPLNNTGKGRGDIVIMTKIPRTGTTNLRQLLKALKKMNDFLVVMPPLRSSPSDISILTKEKQKSLVEKVDALNSTSIIVDDFPFVDFSLFSRAQPIQVSMIREPVQRQISAYYFARSSADIVEKHNHFPEMDLPQEQFLRQTLETCLKTGGVNKDECAWEMNAVRPGHTMHFFCGNLDPCRRFGNETVLEIAEKNVEKYFSVVGVLEELEKTLVVLEHYVPRFFKGAYGLYQEMVASGKNSTLRNRNNFRPSVEKGARKEMNILFSVEKRFYDFVRDRLNKQYEQILHRSLLSGNMQPEKI